VSLSEELARAAEAAARHARDGEELAAVLPAEPPGHGRVFVCAFDGPAGRSWLAVDADGRPVRRRALVREAVSIAAMCELAEDAAGGGDLEELRSQLATLRLTEDPPGIEEAEEAALALERTVGSGPHVASPARLDEVGAATRRLELALGDGAPSPFAAAMQAGAGAVEELATEIEASYRLELE
jgi:hypothetical protein